MEIMFARASAFEEIIKLLDGAEATMNRCRQELQKADVNWNG